MPHPSRAYPNNSYTDHLWSKDVEAPEGSTSTSGDNPYLKEYKQTRTKYDSSRTGLDAQIQGRFQDKGENTASSLRQIEAKPAADTTANTTSKTTSTTTTQTTSKDSEK